MKRLMNLVLMFSAISFVFVGVASAAGPPEIINPGGWKDDGSLVRLSDPSDSVSIGENAGADTANKLNIKDGYLRVNFQNHLIYNDTKGLTDKPYLLLESPVDDYYGGEPMPLGMRISFKSTNSEWSIGPTGCYDTAIYAALLGKQPFQICKKSKAILGILPTDTGSYGGAAAKDDVYITSRLKIGGGSYAVGDPATSSYSTSAALDIWGNLVKITGPDSIGFVGSPVRLKIGGNAYLNGTDNDSTESSYISSGYDRMGSRMSLSLSNSVWNWSNYFGNRWVGTSTYGSLMTMNNGGFNFFTGNHPSGHIFDETSGISASNIVFRIDNVGDTYFKRLVDKADSNYYTQPSQDSFFNRIYANTYNSISDIRLKENIKPLAKPLAKILKLNGVQFNWKDSKEGSKKESIGLIAQDVEKVFPEIVSSDKNGMKSVEYANLVAPLIEAVKEQQKEIESLRSEVEALKKGK